MFLSGNYYKVCSMCLMVLMLLCYSCSLVFFVWDLSAIMDFEFMVYGSASLSLTCYFDWASLLFGGFICLISGSIILYSDEYMEGESFKILFLVLLSLFVFSMLVVVFSLNLISLMLGWDGLGLVSFLLVVFYRNTNAVSSATITALSNRVGDGAILILLGVAGEFGVWKVEDVSLLFEGVAGLLLVVLIVLASITKSAQVPFSAWLPRAMAAPTPVSALVHSSTLVTAGVYLMFRFASLLEESGMSFIILSMGVITMLVASVSASFEHDMKKIIALSTLSQLGFMVISLGLGFSVLAFFHLLMHAVFKALLFMCSGDLIHNSQGAQDVRFMGGSARGQPYTSLLINLCGLSLCGFPFLCGFYSKDAIMEMGFCSEQGSMLMFTILFGVGLSGAYTVRLTQSSMVIPPSRPSFSCLYEPRGFMFMSKLLLPLLVLVSGIIFSGLLFSSRLILSLSCVEKISTMLFTGMGFILGVVSSSYFSWSSSMNIGSYTADLLSSIGHMSSLSGEISADFYKSMSAFGFSVESTSYSVLSGAYMYSNISSMSAAMVLAQRGGLMNFISMAWVLVILLVL
uniref:NADH-ubiquinone oxidoreductase chain 5 n=1 Tax=Gyge ovalis TaxID=2008693 RepID=A0A343DSD5_9CRUS|nr:NADH dehydrogenase subunit 5 [Gyge ovalis]ASC43042.1 NADH dehydrogenase subunit 5 [Gyge ovalis]